MLCRKILRIDPPASRRQRLVILGSTGSIGESALALCRSFPEYLEVWALSAHVNAARLCEQAREFRPKYVVLSGECAENSFKLPLGTEALFGPAALCEIAAIQEADVILAAIVGMACLEPVLAALAVGKKVALANKESVVCGGSLLEDALACGGSIVPVDSEHSSLFQCLYGRSRAEVSKLVLTASGGPFLNTPLAALKDVTPSQALRHPRWSMGAKISVDSATMMNKALEVIEAHWLFGVSPIDVLLHPESIVHSLVSLCDGSMLAHMSVPDMRAAIAFGLMHPDLRLCNAVPPLSLGEIGRLNFLEFDHERFPALRLAYRCLEAGAPAPAVLSIANEIAVQAFLQDRIGFSSIVALCQAFLDKFGVSTCGSAGELRLLYQEMNEKGEEYILPFLKS